MHWQFISQIFNDLCILQFILYWPMQLSVIKTRRVILFPHILFHVHCLSTEHGCFFPKESIFTPQNDKLFPVDFSKTWFSKFHLKSNKNICHFYKFLLVCTCCELLCSGGLEPLLLAGTEAWLPRPRPLLLPWPWPGPLPPLLPRPLAPLPPWLWPRLWSRNWLLWPRKGWYRPWPWYELIYKKISLTVIGSNTLHPVEIYLIWSNIVFENNRFI